ncbi:M23 family metallopeptidase [Proteinivorax tanatarense]|uniref:M23 family metallopeptidase n=1 Tax=Proteinivorax tanatarense TaxID=1260629 RepID=A0AAU7VIU0_9FIRM
MLWVIGIIAIVIMGCTAPKDDDKQEEVRYYQGESIYLDFPFEHGGRYYIGQGGHQKSQNYHYWNEKYNKLGINVSMRYAVDIHMIGEAGIDREVDEATSLDDFTMYKVTLYSPTDGVIEYVEDGHPDMGPDDRDSENLWGNHIIINVDDVKIVLAHLKYGSIIVEKGQKVKKGDHLAKIGKSGNAVVPHLHIQAAKNDPWNGQPVPMLFDGEFLIKGDIVKVDCAYNELEDK